MNKLYLVSAALLISAFANAQTPAAFEVPGATRALDNPKTQANLAPLYTDTKIGLNWTYAANKLGQRGTISGVPQPAAFNISGIPAGAAIQQAYLWCTTSGTGIPIGVQITNPMSTTAGFNMDTIGSGPDKCWGYAGTYAYRADVTSIIDGNGAYMIDGFPTDPPITDDDTDGAGLLIVWADASETWSGTIVIEDGLEVVMGGPSPHTVSGFNATMATVVQGFTAVGDFQFDGYTVTVNGDVTGGQFNWFDFDEQWTSFPGGTTSCDFIVETTGDCYAWVAAGVYYSPVLVDPFVEGLEQENTNLSLFPNPTSGELNIAYTTASTGQIGITVMNALGQQVLTVTQPAIAGDNSFQLDLDALAPGVYTVKVGSGQKRLVVR